MKACLDHKLELKKIEQLFVSMDVSFYGNTIMTIPTKGSWIMLFNINFTCLICHKSFLEYQQGRTCNFD